MIRYILIGLTISFLLLSCGKRNPTLSEKQQIIEDIIYVKDYKHGICYAITHWIYHGRTMATVPCKKVGL